MQHYVDIDQKRRLGMIQILNDKGYNIIHIDNTYQLFTEFEPANEAADIHFIFMRGKDVTSIIEQAIDKNGYTPMMEQELAQLISQEPERAREYSKDTPWIKYIAKGR